MNRTKAAPLLHCMLAVLGCVSPRGLPAAPAVADDAEGRHSHGLNERMSVQSLMEGRRFLYEVVKIYVRE